MVKSDADRCLEKALYKDDFINRMKKIGYKCIIDGEQGLVVIDTAKDRKIYLQQFFGDEYSYNRVLDRTLELRNIDELEITDGKRYKMNIEDYNKILERKRQTEIKKLPALYLIFCLLLKIDPLPAKIDFKNVRVPLTKEMKIELKYMNEISRQAILLNENKIGSLEDLNEFRSKLEDEVRMLKGTRENLQRKKRKSSKKDDINRFTTELQKLAPRIKRLNEDIQNCYKIEKRTILWKREADKVLNKGKEMEDDKNRKKNKKYVR